MPPPLQACLLGTRPLSPPPATHVITTGATLLGMMDLALLLCKPVVWKEWTLGEC